MMEKERILELYEQKTGITYKHQPLFIGDVYRNEFGTMGIVLFEDNKYVYKKTNGHSHCLPDDKAGMNNSEFVANVIQDEELMTLFIQNNIIQDKGVNMTEETKEAVETLGGQIAEVEVVQEVKAKKSTKKETKEVAKEVAMNIYQKINAIRKVWSESNVEKEGKGRAGGGAKYEYYKPQQIIDFCLKQELENNLYSRFSVLEDKCYYEVVNLDNTSEKEMVMCPFDVPRKMAASEAQQVGAAMTYHNRRLAMMMYKIEDNSKESVDVMDNADYTSTVEIPAPPVIPAPPIPPVEQKNVQSEGTSEPIKSSIVSDEQTIAECPKNSDRENEQISPATQMAQKIVENATQNIPTPPTPPVPPTAQTIPEQTVSVPPKTGSIEDLY